MDKRCAGRPVSNPWEERNSEKRFVAIRSTEYYTHIIRNPYLMLIVECRLHSLHTAQEIAREGQTARKAKQETPCLPRADAGGREGFTKERGKRRGRVVGWRVRDGVGLGWGRERSEALRSGEVQGNAGWEKNYVSDFPGKGWQR